MRLRRSEGQQASEADRAAATPSAERVKYLRPKVFLIDLPGTAAEPISGAGYNVSIGTLGAPVAVEPADRFVYVPQRAELPNYTEQEIVVVDLQAPRPVDAPLESAPPGEKAVWQRVSSGLLDPRPLACLRIHDDLDRIQRHGGVFVFFLAPPSAPDYAFGQSNHGVFYSENELSLSSWGLMSDLNVVRRRIDSGEEIDVPESVPPLLARHLRESSFAVTVDRTYDIPEDRWIPLARSKFGETVAAAIGPDTEGDNKGWLFLLPRVPRKGELVKELLDDLFPRIRSELFPFTEGKLWIDGPDYQLPRVRELQAQIQKAEHEADERIRKLRDEIAAAREEHAFMEGILTESGDELVEAVISTLRFLGFSDVRNVDQEEAPEESKDDRKERRKREDIQIHDRPPVILSEVKGVVGLPREAETLQVIKYLMPRAKEWGRTDIRGLSIVNHQRNLPPLDRERDNVFQGDVLTNAEEHDFGLLTTFDLYRLARGYLRHGWRHEDVDGLFYRRGRIEPVPEHYQLIGTIKGFWEQAEAVGIELEGTLSVGDAVAYELPLEFEEERVESMQLNDQPVEQAESGDHVGVKTALVKAQARNNVRVFRVLTR